MTDFRDRVFGYKRSSQTNVNAYAVLEKIPIFQELSRRELASIERILHRREYVPDEVIIRQDEPGLGMYIIESGKAAVLSEPDKVRLSDLTDGDFFGEVSLLDETPRSATVAATTHCRVLGFFQSDLFSLIERDPRLGVKIVVRVAKIIGDRLRKANQQLLSVSEELRRTREGNRPA